jgi:hypothetical protein
VRVKPPSHPGAAALALAILTVAASPVTALAEEGKVVVEQVEYRGWKNNLRIANGAAELIVTLDVGPRVISYRLAGGKNVFKEYDDQMGGTAESDWMIRGGHRLWAGPEDTTRTYALDNGPVAHREVSPGVVRFTPAPETAFGLRKEIDVRLASSGSRVSLVHRITNVGSAETELAPWALSVMAPGGVEVIPLPSKHPHPGSPKNARSAADFAPNQVIVAWPFTDFQDPRWQFGSKYITLRQDAGRGPTKLGLAHRRGAVGYLNQGTLFVKRFGYVEGQPYPDRGVNFETFTNQDMLEVESLGPLVKLSPGRSVEHVEEWELFGGLGKADGEAELEASVGPRLKP